jgi:hypothetical protein
MNGRTFLVAAAAIVAFGAGGVAFVALATREGAASGRVDAFAPETSLRSRVPRAGAGEGETEAPSPPATGRSSLPSARAAERAGGTSPSPLPRASGGEGQGAEALAADGLGVVPLPDDPRERGQALLEVRKQRQANMMQWLNGRTQGARAGTTR